MTLVSIIILCVSIAAVIVATSTYNQRTGINDQAAYAIFLGEFWAGTRAFVEFYINFHRFTSCGHRVLDLHRLLCHRAFCQSFADQRNTQTWLRAVDAVHDSDGDRSFSFIPATPCHGISWTFCGHRQSCHRYLLLLVHLLLVLIAEGWELKSSCWSTSSSFPPTDDYRGLWTATNGAISWTAATSSLHPTATNFRSSLPHEPAPNFHRPCSSSNVPRSRSAKGFLALAGTRSIRETKIKFWRKFTHSEFVKILRFSDKITKW